MGSVLIFHASAGNGHRSVAQAIAQAMPDNVQTCVADILSFGAPLFRLLYGKGYEFSAKYMRWFVHGIFSLTDHACGKSRLVELSEAATCAAVQEALSLVLDNHASVVCCTHFLPVSLMCRLRRKGLYHGSVQACVTDYDVHGFWFDPDVDLYHVATQEAVERLADYGVARDRIRVSGIPVRAEFACAKKVRREHKGLTVLFMASSLRLGECRKMLAEMGECGVPCTVHLVTGRNAALFEQVQVHPPVVSKSLTLIPHGLVRDVAALMRRSDLLITKPGGITVTEGLVQHLPMLLVAPIPMHEVHNARILQKAGAGLACFERGSLARALEDMASDPQRLESMREGCASLARPNAARDIGACLALAARQRHVCAPLSQDTQAGPLFMARQG